MTGMPKPGRRAAAIWLPVTLATVVAAAGLIAGLRRSALARGCVENLETIYRELEAYHRDRGVLPILSFFPDDVYTDPDSLYAVLAAYGIRPSDGVCPSLRRHMGDLGMTYVWNVNLNGRALDELGADAWMLVEISALSRSLPPPHGGHYHILYTDGRVERSPYPPPGL